jgi:hypothetical protein
MGEHGAEFTIEVEDVEAHRMVTIDGPDEDDVEAHIQPPRSDDSDHLHS